MPTTGGSLQACPPLSLAGCLAQLHWDRKNGHKILFKIIFGFNVRRSTVDKLKPVGIESNWIRRMSRRRLESFPKASGLGNLTQTKEQGEPTADNPDRCPWWNCGGKICRDADQQWYYRLAPLLLCTRRSRRRSRRSTADNANRW